MTEMNPTNSEILYAYTRQLDGQGHTSAGHEETMYLAMDVVDEMKFPGYDIDKAHADLASGADRVGVPLSEYVSALDLLASYTNQDLFEAAFGIERVIRAFRELTGQLYAQ